MVMYENHVEEQVHRLARLEPVLTHIGTHLGRVLRVADLAETGVIISQKLFGEDVPERSGTQHLVNINQLFLHI